MAKHFASKILFTTREGQVVCNYIYINDGRLVNHPIGEHALTSTLEKQFSNSIYSPHPDISAQLVPNENPEGYLKLLPYLYNGAYYRATGPQWLDIECSTPLR